MTRPKAILPIGVEDRGINMLVFSHPGDGKTVLAGTSPKALILAPITDNPDSAAIAGSKADIWRIGDWDDLDEAEEYMRHEGVTDYEWCWLDTITLFQELGLDGIMTNLVAEKPHRKLYLPDKGEYGQNMNRLSRFCRNMKGLDINFGVTAHVLKTEDEDGKIVYMPSIQGRGMPEKICGYMGVVGYLKNRTLKTGVERKLITAGSRYYTKDLYGNALGGGVLNPTIPKIEALIKDKIANAPKATPHKASNGVTKKTVAKKATKTTTKRSA